MKKRTLSVLIILALLVSNLAAPTYLAEASSIVKVAYDPFLVKLEADQKTVIPDDGDNAFGTEAAAGRIWTDKSVEATVDGKFNVELSALAQEYIIQGSGTNGSGGYASSKAPMVDVTFILDMSGSMGITQNGKLLGNDINHETDGIIYRVDAMQRAVNHVIKTVMEANPKNRVAVHWFTGTGNAGTLMPLNSYTTEDANKRYIDYSVSSSNIHTLKNVDSLKITGSNSVVKFSKDVGGGTPTQDGIMYGVQQMITDIGTGQKAIDAPTRTPFVLVLSDGAASSGKDGWYVPASSGSASGNAVSGSAKITAVTILTGRYMKDQLDSKYQHYNNNDTTIKSQFYTVGLGSEQDIYGVSDGGVRDYSAYPWATLDPKDLYARRNDTQGSAKSIHNAIVSYATAQSKPANIKDYSNDYGYSDYYTFADTYTKLIGAFDQLANDAASASKIPPILNLPLGQASGEDTITDHITRAINMTDEIGEGFQIEVNTLKIGNSVAKVEETISNGVVYGFDGYQSKVAIQTVDGVTTLKWFIQADDLKNHIYTFKDRDIPKPGEYNAPKDGPFKLNYRLIPSIEETPDSITKTTYFSNAMDGAEAKTTAYFTPPSDNPYYMNFEETTISKTNGLAGTANYISKETISDGKVSIKLGNNGRLDVEMGVVKSGPEQVKVSDTIKYPVTVYNYTDSDKTVSIQSEGQNRTDISVPGKSSSTEEFTTTAPNTTTEKLTSNVATVDVDGKTITSNTVDTKVVNKINYTVIFDSQGGSAVADVSVLEGTTVLKPVDPAYNDRNFLGWYKEVAYTTAWDFQTDIVTENITLYAKWNNTPTVSNYTATAEYNASVSGIVEGTDIDGDSLTYSKGSDPSNGTVTVNADGTWTYMPNTNYVGSDSFTVTVTDEHGATTVSTVNVTVNAKPNTSPTVGIDSVTTEYNTPVGGTVVGTDADGDALSYTKGSGPANGTVTVNTDGTWTYTPKAGFTGSDSFTVTVSDGRGGTAVSTVNVTVNAQVIPPVEPPVNTPPTVGNYTVTTGYNTPATGTVAGTDANGDALSYTKASNPTNGTVTVNADGTWTYTPNTDYSGSDSFTVTVSDGRGGTAVSTIKVTVEAKLPAYAINMNANPNSIIGDGKSTTVLTVTIVDSNNKPQENVKVEFSAPIGSFSNGNSAFTDSNGKASVIFKSDKIEGINTQVVPVKATAQDEIRKLHAQGQIEITFEPGSIRGTVVDNETGHPIKGAKVVVKKDFDGDGTIDFLSEMVTGSDGKYNIAVPKGDLVYDVFITAPMMVNGNLEDKTFLQKSEAGNITGKLFEQFDSLKTAAGLVLLKNTDGSIGYLKDYSKITVEVQMNNSGAGYHSDVSNENTSAGVFNIGDLEKDKKYTIDVIYNFDNGQKIIIGKMNAVLDSDGQINISQVLIDPYGIVTDKSTGEIIEGADIKLYYADTARNAANGNKAGELVNLPILEGFPPADNRNPQVSDAEGNYAYMVFPHADYYLVATKPGYETFISETIEVYEEIVRFDIGMMADKKSASTGSETDSKPVTKLPKTGFMLGIEIYELLLVFFVITFIVLISSRFSRKRKI